MASLMPQNQPNASLAVVDDTMELSSDRGAGDDHIDIDIDLDGYSHQGGDDETMVEDDNTITQDNLIPNDDFMADGDRTGHDVDAGMMEDEITYQDEEIYDANQGDQDIDLGDDVHISRHHRDASNLPDVTVTEHPNPFDPHEDTIEYDLDPVEQAPVEFNPTLGPQDAPATFEENLYSDDLALGNDPTGPVLHESEEIQQETGDHQQYDTSADTNTDNLAQPHTDFTEEQTDAGKEAPNHDDVSHEEFAAAPEAPQDDQPHEYGTETTLHPVSVAYEGGQFELFGTSESESASSYILDDLSTAHGLLKDLMTACKDVLLGHADETLELELEVPALGLFLTEDSKHASTLSLNEILEIYLQLSWNDGVEAPEPLVFVLTIRNSFEDRMKQLREAASSGAGLSQMVSPDESDESYHQEESAEQYFGDEEAENESSRAQGQAAGTSGGDNDTFDNQAEEQQVGPSETEAAVDEDEISYDDDEEENIQPPEGEEEEEPPVEDEVEDEFNEDALEARAEEGLEDFGEIQDDENGEPSGSSTTVEGDYEEQEQQQGTAFDEGYNGEETYNDDEHQNEHEFEQEFAQDARALDEQDGQDDFNNAEDLEVPSLAVDEEFGDEDPEQGDNFQNEHALDDDDQITYDDDEGDFKDQLDLTSLEQPPEESATEALDSFEEDWEAGEDQIDINDFYPEEDVQGPADPSDTIDYEDTEEFDFQIPAEAQAPTSGPASQKRSRAEQEGDDLTSGHDAKKARAT